MIGLLSEVGKKIADRWLTALILPGLLFVGALTCAWLLGHGHAVDGHLLADQVGAHAAKLDGHPAAIAVVAVLALLVATATGYAAQTLTGPINAVWTASQPRWIVKRRRDAAERRQPKQPKPYLSDRLTTAGDHWRLAGARVQVHYGLDLNRVWPRLWLLISADTRAVMQKSYDAYHSALVLTAWGLLYLGVGCWWWPAAVAGLIVAGIGCRRGNLAAAATAELIEATVDLNIKALATALDAEHNRVITDSGAVRIANVLAKRQLP